MHAVSYMYVVHEVDYTSTPSNIPYTTNVLVYMTCTLYYACLYSIDTHLGMYVLHAYMAWRALSYVIVTAAYFAKIIMRSLHYYVELCVLLAHHSVLSRVLWRSETPRQLECDYYYYTWPDTEIRC